MTIEFDNTNLIPLYKKVFVDEGILVDRAFMTQETLIKLRNILSAKPIQTGADTLAGIKIFVDPYMQPGKIALSSGGKIVKVFDIEPPDPKL